MLVAGAQDDMDKNGSLVAVHSRPPGTGVAPAQWTRWLGHFAQTAGTQVPQTSEAATAVALVWRAAREGHRGLLFTAVRSPYTSR